ncbi:hypothetical protein [Nocardiopsis sp. LOL_012]|uniref:hypothetical protein n=1 Tax=Nocardiopsis sp. LOL_012 TaxID=3345409 RepID=UPI003A89CD18
MTDRLTRWEQLILDLIRAAEQAGYDPVAEIPDDAPPRTVDLRVMDGLHVAAAIRAHLTAQTWRYEIPVRVQGRPRAAIRTRHLAHLDEPLTVETLRPLDHYFARATDLRPPTPRPPWNRLDTPGWMLPGYWERHGLPTCQDSVRR